MLKPDPAELPLEIYTVDSVRQLDRAAIDGGIKGYALMTRAAESALDAARSRFPETRRWQVVCGSGNNAGDGYVLARLAAQQGIAVSVVAVSAPENLRGDAESAYGDFFASGGSIGPWDGSLDAEADLLFDALLGSGLSRDVDGDIAAAVDAINAHPAPVVALDIPTGLHGDTGRVLGRAVRADLTVTFVGLKSGLFLNDGPAHTGAIVCAGLGIPAELHTGVRPGMRRLTSDLIRRRLPRRHRTAHKGDFGHLVIVGGGPGMPGAARLAGEAALRAGAGRVSLAVHPVNVPAIVAGRPELMCHGTEDPGALLPLIAAADVVALGPGLGTGAWSRALFDAVLDSGKPLVIDADGLNLLAAATVRHDDWVLTPHPGEAARLIGCSAADVQRDRLKALGQLVGRFGGTVVLKGAGTLVSASDGPPWLCTAGNPGMAAAGMGDVLTGVVAALRAQGLAPEPAATVGVQLHAQAGDRAACQGERGMLAGDLMGPLRELVNP